MVGMGWGPSSTLGQRGAWPQVGGTVGMWHPPLPRGLEFPLSNKATGRRGDAGGEEGAGLGAGAAGQGWTRAPFWALCAPKVLALLT